CSTTASRPASSLCMIRTATPRGVHATSTTEPCKRRKLIKDAHTAIITAETWRDYLAERDKRRLTHSTKARHPKWFLGGGLAVCGNCGHNLIVTTCQQGQTSQAKCSRYQIQRSCPGVWINRDTLE